MSYKIMRFTASWCGPCKILAKNLDQTELELPIRVVDIEEEQQITQQYRVRAVPTMIIVDENDDVCGAPLVGLKTNLEIKKWIKEIING